MPSPEFSYSGPRDWRTRKVLPLVGYGVFRLLSDEDPWFHRVDYEEAVPESIRKFVIPSKSHVTKVQSTLQELGLIDLEMRAPGTKGGGGGLRQPFMAVREAAIEPYVGELLSRVRTSGDSLVEILHVPESVETVLERTDFIERHLRDVVGLEFQYRS